MSERQWLYHEKQEAGLCGVHTLNNLLQGPFFSEVDLMQIAQDLDAEEKRVMAEMGTETPEYLQFVAVCLNAASLLTCLARF